MNLYDAIQILRLHNQYFRCPAHIPDDARPPLVDAWALAEAIDVVLSELHAASYASTQAQLQVDQLQADLMESDEIREKLGHLLTRTAAALKGEPPAGVWHSWHDLPEKATQLAEALAKEKDKQSDDWARALRLADAARWRYIRRKLCLTGNGNGTCAMQAINLPANIQGWPEPGQVAEFCDAAIDAAMSKEGRGND